MKARTLAATFAALTLVATPAAIASGGGANPDHVTVIDGANRYETAAQIALTTGPGGAIATLYIANGETLADAVVAGATTPLRDTKLLLVKRDEVPPATRDALQRIKHAELVFLGGDAVISPAVRDEVMSLTENYAYPN